MKWRHKLINPFSCGAILPVHDQLLRYSVAPRKSCGMTLENVLIKEVAISKHLEIEKQAKLLGD